MRDLERCTSQYLVNGRRSVPMDAAPALLIHQCGRRPGHRGQHQSRPQEQRVELMALRSDKHMTDCVWSDEGSVEPWRVTYFRGGASFRSVITCPGCGGDVDDLRVRTCSPGHVALRRVGRGV